MKVRREVKERGQRVEVAWTDARSTSAWKTESEFREWQADVGSVSIESCGYLIHADEKTILVCLSRDTCPGDRCMMAHILEIPRKMVKSIRELR